MQAKASITSIVWTPEGRRCIIGSQRGEFTIWGGTTFTYDTALQVAETSTKEASARAAECQMADAML